MSAPVPVAAVAVAARHWALRPVASDSWDGLLWTSGAVGLTGILLASMVPALTDLSVFFTLTLLVNGPYSPFLPAAHEPVLMIFGRLYPPVLIAALGTIAVVMVEYLNYRLYDAALRVRLLEGARESRSVRAVLRCFGLQPFLTVAFCALTPVPFWVARIAAPLAGYSVRRFLTATAVGRFPRLWFYALLGTALPVRSEVLLVGGLGATVLVAVLIVARRRVTAEAT